MTIGGVKCKTRSFWQLVGNSRVNVLAFEYVIISSQIHVRFSDMVAGSESAIAMAQAMAVGTERNNVPATDTIKPASTRIPVIAGTKTEVHRSRR